MKKSAFALLCIFMCLVSCKTRTGDLTQKERFPEKGTTDTTTLPILLKMSWQTGDVLDVPECVLPLPGNQYVVSNVNGDPSAVDNNGYLSLISGKGKIIEKEWISGLSAPKGMAISGGLLFVSDIQDLVEIDLKGGKILARYHVPEAKFLNDVAADEQGNIYISDSQGAAIYRLKGKEMEYWIGDEKLSAVNGLLVYDGVLYAGTGDQVVKIDMATATLKPFIDHTGPVDGLAHFQGQQFIISDWTGHVYLVEPQKERQLLLDTTEDKLNAADFGYDSEHNLLLVPTFSGNSVVAYTLNL